MAKELLIDSTMIRLQLVEDASGNGKLIAKGEFGRGDSPTANRRIYPTKLFKREINRLAESMKGRKVYGELDHPEDGKTKLSRASHLVLGLKADENGVIIGEAEVLDTAQGKDLKAILDAGGAVGISSRGYGSVKMSEDGQYNVVQDDYQLMTFDFVADPAQGTAYPEFKFAEQSDMEGSVTENEKQVITDKVIDGLKPEPTQPQLAENKEATAALTEAPEAPVAAPLQEMVGTDIAKYTQAEVDAIKALFFAEKTNEFEKNKDKIREELMSELLTDPKIAGAKTALESVKQALRPLIIEADIKAEIEKVQAEVEAERKAKDEALKIADGLKAENAELMTMCRELGFNLYMERTLAKHPKYKEICESIDYAKVESLAELKKMTAPYVDELGNIAKTELEKTNESVVALTKEIATLKEERESLTVKLKESQTEKDFAIKLGMESAARAYMERKIVGNQNASLIREKFEGLSEKTKTHVDALVEACSVSVASARESLNESVRRRFRGGAGVVTEAKASDPKVSDASSSTMVEDSLKGTKVIREDKSNGGQVVPGFDLNLKEFEKLSGLASPKH